MTRLPSWVGGALVACLREQDAEVARAACDRLLARHDPLELAAAARAHHVESCVYDTVRSLPAAEPIVPTLAAASAAYRRHQLRLKADLRTVATVLDEAEADWMIVKGPYLAELAYARPNVRDYVDLDVVVARRDFPAVVRALLAQGYDVVRRDWSLAARQLAGEIDLVGPAGTPVDLHWALLYHDDLRRRFALQVEPMLRRARSVTIAGTRVRVPDAADALIQVAVHAFREGGVRLQWLSDLDQIVHHDPPDWSAVVARSRDGRVGLVTGTLLLRAARLLGTPVPDDALAALLPASWRALLLVTDQLSPPARSLAHGSLSSLLTRSTCADPRASVPHLVASLLDVVRGRARAPVKPRETVTGEWDPRNSRTELDRYLGAVAAAGA